VYRFDPTELTKFAGLTLLARRVVEGFLTGVHRSPYKGFSIEFAEHRQYYPGDEIRHIDWRAFGKTDRYYIKEYEEETNLKLYLVLDASGSMKFRGTIAKVSKFEYAQRVAASLAYLMLHQLDAVGLITHDTQVRSLIPPKTSPKHLLNLITTLEKTTPGGETALAPIWDQLANHHLKRRGMVVILSDFFDAIDPVVRALRHLKFRHHEVILMQVLAPEEMDFPYDRATEFRSLERTNWQLRVDPRRLRQEYRTNFEAFCANLKTQAGKLHFDYHRLRTDEPIETALGIYLSRRQK
jgi:uncharacterized protein (DUF58 family)